MKASSIKKDRSLVLIVWIFIITFSFFLNPNTVSALDKCECKVSASVKPPPSSGESTCEIPEKAVVVDMISSQLAQVTYLNALRESDKANNNCKEGIYDPEPVWGLVSVSNATKCNGVNLTKTEKRDYKKGSLEYEVDWTTNLKCAVKPATTSTAPSTSEKKCECTFTFKKKEGSTNCQFEAKSIQNIGPIDLYSVIKVIDPKSPKCSTGVTFPTKSITLKSPCSSNKAIESFTDGGKQITAGMTCASVASAAPKTPAAADTSAGAVDAEAVLKARYKKPEGYEGPLPDCAFSGTCKDVDDLLLVAIRIGRMIFGFLGSFALVMFVYGGFIWVTSFGNAEKVKKGQSVVVAAVVGMAIALGAYVIIKFLLDTLTVQSGFRLL